MTHLTATIAASPESMRAIDRTAQSDGAGRPARQLQESTFYSPVANFLELLGAAFHYSVIGVRMMNTLAPGLGDRHISYDAGLMTQARPRTRGEMLLVCGHEQATNDGSTQIKPVAARTGGRKSHANGCGFAARMQVDITDTRISMMQISENIHATYPPYATVAPILHKRMRAIPTGRGTTSNTGAADV